MRPVRLSGLILFVFILFIMSIGGVAHAQTSVTASVETFALRDIARTTTPVDASPVAWTGSGPRIDISRVWTTPRRSQRVTLEGVRVSNFHYDSVVSATSRPAGGSMFRISGQYEQRRFFFRDVLVTGFDLGAGVRADVLRHSLSRQIDGGLETNESRTAAAGAFVVAARYRLGDRTSIDAGWANGVHVGRSSERHSASPDAARSSWGGGWVTDLDIRAVVGLSGQVSLALQYRQWDDALMASHRHITTRRHVFGAGVTYAR